MSLNSAGGGANKRTIDQVLSQYLDDITNLPGFTGPVKAINLRSLKVFMTVGTNLGAPKGLTAHEIENLIEYLDTDKDGFIVLLEL